MPDLMHLFGGLTPPVIHELHFDEFYLLAKAVDKQRDESKKQASQSRRRRR